MAALAIGKKTAELTEADLPAIKDVLLKMKANAKLVGDVTASQTALATGEVDILVGGGEWVTAGLAKENPALDFSIPKEGAVLWSQSLAMFKDSKNKDLALKFIQYIMSPEGQARLATSSCYWGMPANTQGGADRRAEEDPALRRAAGLPRPRPALSCARTPISTRRCRTSGPRCCRRSERLPRMSAAEIGRVLPLGAGHAGARAGRCSSSSLPFVVMAVLSLTAHGGRRLDARQLRPVLRQPELLPGDGELAGGDGDRHRRLGAARLSLRLDPRRAGAGALAAAGADARHPAVLDLLCRALLQLAAGAGRERRRQPRADCGSASSPSRCSSPTRGSPPSSASCISSSCC